jgi:hypothetical protein
MSLAREGAERLVQCSALPARSHGASSTSALCVFALHVHEAHAGDGHGCALILRVDVVVTVDVDDRPEPGAR